MSECECEWEGGAVCGGAEQTQRKRKIPDGIIDNNIVPSWVHHNVVIEVPNWVLDVAFYTKRVPVLGVRKVRRVRR